MEHWNDALIIISSNNKGNQINVFVQPEIPRNNKKIPPKHKNKLHYFDFTTQNSLNWWITQNHIFI